MKTTIATVVFVSSLLSSQAFAAETPATDILESSLARSIHQDVSTARQQVKEDNTLDVMQMVADFKFALNPSAMMASIAETASDLLSNPKE